MVGIRGIFIAAICCSLTGVSFSINTQMYQHASQLKQFLFASSNNSYDLSVLPQIDSKKPVMVTIGLALRQIIDLDERNQILFSSLWYRWSWTDPRLAWDPDDYGGLKVIRSKPGAIWTPDIILYNDIREEAREVSEFEVYIHNNGLVQWNFPVLIKSSCRVEIKYYPYDQQLCPLKYGSWAYDGYLIDVTNRSTAGDDSKFTRSGEFDLKNITVRRHVEHYKCCPEPYPDITFHIVIRRKPDFMIYNLFLPCIVICVITITGFYLPPDSGEKIALGMTTLLALFVFLLLVGESMPPQSDVVPYINRFFISTTLMITVSVACTVGVLYIYYHGQHGNKLPEGVKKFFFVHVARALCMRDTVKDLELERDDYEERKKKSGIVAVKSMLVVAKSKKAAQQEESKRAQVAAASVPPPTETRNKGAAMVGAFFKGANRASAPAGPVEVEAGESTKLKVPEIAIPTNVKEKELIQLRETVNLIYEKIKVFERQSLEQEYESLIEAEWRLLAIIIDRILLIVFFITTVIICCVFLIVTPDYSITEEMLEHKDYQKD